MNHEHLDLKEYRCKKCDRVFYIDAMDRHPLKMDFGCPLGCDDGIKHMRNIVAVIQNGVDEYFNDSNQIKNRNVLLSFSEEEFERSMGREPEDQDEFGAWAEKAEDLLCDLIDWEIIFDSVHDAFQR